MTMSNAQHQSAAVHCMIDMETLSTHPNMAIMSIGLVLFGLDGVIDTKELILDTQDQISAGRDVEFGTIQWWMKQSAPAASLFDQCAGVGVTAREACHQIASFLHENCRSKKNLFVWGNSSTFDVVGLRSLYTQFSGLPKDRLWNYPNERCFRTLVAVLDPQRKFEPVRTGVHHNALDDALWQAEYLSVLNARVMRCGGPSFL